MRQRLVQLVLSIFSKLLHHAQGRDEIRRALPKAGAAPKPPMFDDGVIHEVPYVGLGKTYSADKYSKPPSICVTARFRTNSPSLWRLFRESPGVTAYYEPFNEHRWFSAGGWARCVDPTHLGMNDYWLEHEGLSEPSQYYDPAWIDVNLYMDGTNRVAHRRQTTDPQRVTTMSSKHSAPSNIRYPMCCSRSSVEVSKRRGSKRWVGVVSNVFEPSSTGTHWLLGQSRCFLIFANVGLSRGFTRECSRRG